MDREEHQNQLDVAATAPGHTHHDDSQHHDHTPHALELGKRNKRYRRRVVRDSESSFDEEKGLRSESSDGSLASESSSEDERLVLPRRGRR